MPKFRYSLLVADGQVLQDTIDAPSEEHVVEYLHRQGGIPLRIKSAEAAPLLRRLGLTLPGPKRGLRKAELTDLTHELAVMLGAGQDLDGALRFLVEARPQRRVIACVERVRQAVRDGSSLSAAMQQQPDSFPSMYAALVRAGEASGRLAPTLERLAVMLEQQRSLAGTVKTALLYPALLMLAALGSTAFLLTHVLPQFVPLFQQNGVVLPRSTQLLIDFGDAVGRYGPSALIGVLLGLLAFRQLLRRAGPRLLADRLLISTPLVGRLVREVLAARFSRTLGTLLTSRVPLTESLEMLAGTLGNRAGIEAVQRAAEAAKDGGGLAEPLHQTKVFPRRTVYLLRLGEENGQLGQMALRAAEIHEANTQVAVQRLVSVLVPAIIIVMGAIVAAVVSSVLAAMLSLNDLAR